MRSGSEGNGTRDLRTRTKKFALRVIRLCSALPRTVAAGVVGKQLVRSGTSVGAQYREACRARSSAEFVSKMESALQEIDETAYWLELVLESGMVRAELMSEICKETEELIAIFVASVRTAKRPKTPRP